MRHHPGQNQDPKTGRQGSNGAVGADIFNTISDDGTVFLMAWVALSDEGFGLRTARLRPPQMALRLPRGLGPEDVIPRGSLYLEASINRALSNTQSLFVLHRSGPATSHISVQTCDDGTVVFARHLGDRQQQVSLRIGRMLTEGTLRLTVSWDAPQRRGLISAEFGGDGLVLQKEFCDPLPWLAGDVAALNQGGDAVRFDGGVVCFGLSDRQEPVGLAPSLSGAAPVLTPQGYRRADQLCAGDLVQDVDGHAHPIRFSTQRDVPARGRFRPLRLRAPFLGLRRDVIVAPEQRLIVRGPEVEYLFGEERVLVEAQALVGTNCAVPADCAATVRYHQLVLDDHTMLDVAGLPMESLFIGDLRETPEMLATTVLRNAPANSLPLHKKLACPVLRAYEAVTLCAALFSR